MDPLAHGRALREQSAMLAERLAAVEESVAETLAEQARRHPDRAASLLAQSEQAREQAARWGPGGRPVEADPFGHMDTLIYQA